jgi:hypothetical protein
LVTLLQILVSFLFTDSEIKGEFREPLSSGEKVTLEVNREVNATAPVIIDDLVVASISPMRLSILSFRTFLR